MVLAADKTGKAQPTETPYAMIFAGPSRASQCEPCLSLIPTSWVGFSSKALPGLHACKATGTRFVFWIIPILEASSSQLSQWCQRLGDVFAVEMNLHGKWDVTSLNSAKYPTLRGGRPIPAFVVRAERSDISVSLHPEVQGCGERPEGGHHPNAQDPPHVRRKPDPRRRQHAQRDGKLTRFYAKASRFSVQPSGIDVLCRSFGTWFGTRRHWNQRFPPALCQDGC